MNTRDVLGMVHIYSQQWNCSSAESHFLLCHWSSHSPGEGTTRSLLPLGKVTERVLSIFLCNTPGCKVHWTVGAAVGGSGTDCNVWRGVARTHRACELTAAWVHRQMKPSRAESYSLHRKAFSLVLFIAQEQRWSTVTQIKVSIPEPWLGKFAIEEKVIKDWSRNMLEKRKKIKMEPSDRIRHPCSIKNYLPPHIFLDVTQKN